MSVGRVEFDRGEKDSNKSHRIVWVAIGVVVLLLALAAGWRWTPLAEIVSLRNMIRWGVALRSHPAHSFFVIGGYVIAILAMVPIPVLILPTALVFGPLFGCLYSFAGCLAGAVATYAVGYFLGKDTVERIARGRWAAMEHAMQKSGIMAVAALRLLPVAPFTLINIVSGAFKIPLRDYLIGSFLGLAPGILVMNLFAHQFARAVRNPGIGTYLVLAGSIAAAVVGFMWIKRKSRAPESTATKAAQAESVSASG
ncbi:MAG TPA: VTT domain-containing protein [Candidatus Binatia bacterium]